MEENLSTDETLHILNGTGRSFYRRVSVGDLLAQPEVTRISTTSFSFRRSSKRLSVQQVLETAEVSFASEDDEEDEAKLQEEDLQEAKEDYIDESKATPKSTTPSETIDKAYETTTQKGKVGGLFRACMQTIKSQHKEARNVRTALILLGLFTDKALYRDWITIFYVVNKELEDKMNSDEFLKGLPNEQERQILLQLRSLGEKHYFTDLYEMDLAKLHSEDSKSWKQAVQDCVETKPHCLDFRDHVASMTTASQLAGAVFVLWGVYIVGGGAMIRQRAIKLVGSDAVNLYDNVSGAGRARRKADFISFWDDLATATTTSQEEEKNQDSSCDQNCFEDITDSSWMCMHHMNETMKDLSANPWWMTSVVIPVAVAGMGVVIAIGVTRMMK